MAARRRRLPDLGPRGEGWVIAQLALIGILVLVGLPGLTALWPSDLPGWLAFAAGVLALLLAGWTEVRAFRDLGRSLTPLPRPRDDAELVESGIYARLRHPIYAGLILAALGWSALTRSLPAFAVAILLALVLDAKSRREEAWLVERYPSYPAYRLRSKRFLPGVY
jgi:protein-S-isoprenylcysteine O-methyltransferase Ste14